jgi:hypothetical protein
MDTGGDNDECHALIVVVQIAPRISSRQKQSKSPPESFADDQEEKIGEKQEIHDAYNPTAVTNTVRVTTRRLSVHSGKESHEESCARTRPISRPCTKRPTMPG